MVIVPVLSISPDRPALATIPAELLAPVIWMVPSFFTKLFVLIVTATPLVGLTDPVDVMRMSPEALVDCGVVTAVVICVSA